VGGRCPEQGPRERTRCIVLMKERQEYLWEGANRKQRRKMACKGA